METRRQFDSEFKREALQLARESGKSVAAIAKDLGICPSQLYYWRRHEAVNNTDSFPGKGHLLPKDDEIRKLKKDLRDAQMERDILKKAMAVFSRQPI